MPQPLTVPPFAVISGAQVQRALQGREKQITELVEATYRLHGAGDSVNPPSYFLRFPDRPSARIIALPASIGGQGPGGRPEVDLQLPGERGGGHPAGLGRADPQRSRHRLPVRLPGELDHQRHQDRRVGGAGGGLARAAGRPRPEPRVGFFGTGLIARYIHTFLAGTGWSFDEIGVYDLSADSAAGFRGYLEQSGTAGRVTVYEDAEQLIRSSDLVVFATVAGEPHVSDVSWFAHNPVVLHVSLRDLAPEILLASTNLVDDVEHCLKANTSPHLAEQLTGSRDFLAGTLDDVMAGRVTVPADRPVVFSPFGLGVLDLAVGKYVYDEVTRSGELHVIDDFFHELRRYAPGPA